MKERNSTLVLSYHWPSSGFFRNWLCLEYILQHSIPLFWPNTKSKNSRGIRNARKFQNCVTRIRDFSGLQWKSCLSSILELNRIKKKKLLCNCCKKKYGGKKWPGTVRKIPYSKFSDAQMGCLVKHYLLSDLLLIFYFPELLFSMGYFLKGRVHIYGYEFVPIS